MYDMSWTKVAMATALLAACGLASAKMPINADAGSFEEQRKAVLAGLADGETYVEISEPDKAAVRGALDRMQARLAAAGSAEKLSEADRIATFNDQATVNQILTKSEADSRVVCRREKKTGSHRPQASCLTVAERRRQQEQAQQALRDVMPSKLPSGG